jgi:3-oxoacyl-[acyl-carrier-protein] synthase-3
MLEAPQAAAAALTPGPTVAAGIAGLGSALPARVVTNAELEAHLGLASSWIERRTGIRERRHLRPDEPLSDLAAAAAREALADAGLDAGELDLVLVATFTGDNLTPGTAPLVAHALGARAAALDVNAACVGFLHAIDLGAAAIGAGRAQHVLVIGAEAVSRFLDHDDRRTAGLFGDGAGAAVLSVGGGEVAPFVLHSAGEHADVIRATRDESLIRMEGHETFLLATASLCDAATEACAAAGVGLGDIDRFVFHQANRRILATVTERLGLDPARVVDEIADVGNTSAASIPLALAASRPRSGERVLLGAMGAGFVFGAGVMTWP